MAGKKLSPGLAPLGHPPFHKVKLEGPKKHHDFHGNDASVPGKGKPVPGEHWEKSYSMILKEDTRTQAGKEWNPKLAKDRPRTHTNVNEEDH